MAMNTDLSEYRAGIAEHMRMGRKLLSEREENLKRMKRCRFDTVAVHGLYSMEEALERNQGSIIEPTYLSTSQAYRDADEMEAGLAYLIPNWCYARIANPTTYYLEWTLALLEGYGTTLETGAVVTASGMSAIVNAVEPFLVKLSRAADEPINFVSSAHVYGGTFQQFNIRQREKGREVRWVPDPGDLSAWRSRIDEHTRLLYAELPSNPTLNFCDIEKLSEIAHSNGIPLIVDATVATPALMRPLAHGADVVVHSVTKSMTSSGVGVGGVIVSRKNLVSEKITDPPEMIEDFAGWVKFLPFRDNGPSMSPMQALFTLNDLRTLRSKMDLVSLNSQKVAEFLEGHPKVERVDYLGLPSNPLHELAARYMFLVDSDLDGARPVNRFGHLMSFRLRGGGEAARRVFDCFRMIFRATDLGRIKSVATIPAISTHQQQGEQMRALADVPANMIRLNVGGEHPDDIIADLEGALAKA